MRHFPIIYLFIIIIIIIIIYFFWGGGSKLSIMIATLKKNRIEHPPHPSLRKQGWIT